METYFKRELTSKASVFFAILLSFLLTGCISVSHFQAWNGPAEFEGHGGAFITKDGIDIYSSGEPFRKCRILGVVNTSTMSRAELMAVFGDSWSISTLLKEAKRRGANGIMLGNDKQNSWVTGGTDAMGNYQTSTDVARNRVAVLVKYVDINPQSAPQNGPTNLPATTDEVDKQVETALIGHWAMVAHQSQTHGSWADKAEITFLPENRLAAESIQNGKVYPQGGRYSVKGKRLTIIDDQDSRPDTISFSLIENHLIINHGGDEVVFKRTDGSNFQLPAQQSEADRKLLADIRAKAEKGDAQSQYELGCAFSFGNFGVAKDEVEAVKWYRKAAEQNNASGQYNLGGCYCFGHGLAKDEAEAVKWYRKAAEQNYAPAQYNLDFCYAKGEGVAKDEAEAMKWYRKGAEQGNALAQSSLGLCYENGRGVTKDEVEAVKWFRKAAEQNGAGGQTLLGACYAKGSGVAKDEAEAVKWFRKAAEGGDINALNALAWILATSQNSAIRDGASAMVFAEKAVDATNHKDPAALDNLAAAFAEAGQFEKAVSTEQEAIALLRTEPEKNDYRTRLKLFEAKLPYRAKE